MVKNVTIKTEYIKLGQLLKLVGIISNGSDAKCFLDEEKVFVNGEEENRRGRKIYPGYHVKYKDIEVIINEIS